MDWISYDRRIWNISIADDSFSYFVVYGKKMTYNLYYFHPFTGKKLLKAQFKTKKELIEEWMNPVNAEYHLQGTEEKVIGNLPTRPRNNFLTPDY